MPEKLSIIVLVPHQQVFFLTACWFIGIYIAINGLRGQEMWANFSRNVAFVFVGIAAVMSINDAWPWLFADVTKHF